MTVVASNYTREENDLSFDEANRRLRYDPETGYLHWRARPLADFGNRRVAASWNAKNAGNAAGWVGSDGYKRLTIGKRSFLVHRVVWLIDRGQWPDDQIDHIDQNKANNRIENLRPVSNAENARNKPRPATNTSGHVGVRATASGKWRAEIKQSGRKIFLGTFATMEAAISTRQQAATTLGFSPFHGRSR